MILFVCLLNIIDQRIIHHCLFCVYFELCDYFLLLRHVTYVRGEIKTHVKYMLTTNGSLFPNLFYGSVRRIVLLEIRPTRIFPDRDFFRNIQSLFRQGFQTEQIGKVQSLFRPGLQRVKIVKNSKSFQNGNSRQEKR